MKPGTRMLLNRWLSIVDAIGAILLGLSLLATIGLAAFLFITPALPAILTVIDRVQHPVPGRQSEHFKEGNQK